MPPAEVTALQVLCSKTVCRNGEDFVEYAVGVLPCHLAPLLLSQAIDSGNDGVTTRIIACWPLPELHFKDVLSSDQQFLIEEDYMLDRQIFAGITSRRQSCKLKILSFRGLNVNSRFCYMLRCYLPWLSLKDDQLKPVLLAERLWASADDLFKTMVEKLWSGSRCLPERPLTRSYLRRCPQRAYLVPPDTTAARANRFTGKDYLRWTIDEMLLAVSDYGVKIHFQLNAGDTLQVLLEKVELDFRQCENWGMRSKIMKFLIMTRLQPMTSVRVKYSNILVRSSEYGDYIEEKYTERLFFSHQFLKYLLGPQAHEELAGVWLNGIELDTAIYNWQISSCWNCQWLTSLGLRNGNLDVAQSGRPILERRKSQRRLRWLVRLLHGLPNLSSLDLGGNYLWGQLSAILEAVQHPLDRLSLAGHEFSAQDIDAMATWTHAGSLRELDVGHCILYYPASASDQGHFTCPLVLALRRYVALQRLNFANSDLYDLFDLCAVISDGCWPALRSFDVTDNALWQADIERLTTVALTLCTRLGQLCIPSAGLSAQTVNNFVEASGRKCMSVTSPTSGSFVIADGSVDRFSAFRVLSGSLDESYY